MKLRGMTAAVMMAGALAVSGCGSNQTAAAASCLKNALANQALDPSNNNCGDSTFAAVESVNVTCTHKNGNEYVCDVTGESNAPAPSAGTTGFYDVSYDGKSITYQPTQ